MAEDRVAFRRVHHFAQRQRDFLLVAAVDDDDLSGIEVRMRAAIRWRDPNLNPVFFAPSDKAVSGGFRLGCVPKAADSSEE